MVTLAKCKQLVVFSVAFVKAKPFYYLSSDVDECQKKKHNCHVDAQCSNTFGAFNCTCLQGYSGDGVRCWGMRNNAMFFYCLNFSPCTYNISEGFGLADGGKKHTYVI